MKQRIYWTEGEKKSDAACKVGLPTVSVGGCWNWLHKGKPIPDFDEFDWENCEMVLVFDNDIVNKPNVRSALNALAREFRKRGAEVLQILLPFPGPKGLDDYLVEHGKDAFLKLAEQAFEPPPDWVDEINEDFFLAPDGTNMLIFWECKNGSLSALRPEAFNIKQRNKLVLTDDNNKKPRGPAWIAHRDRREYDEVGFDPRGEAKEGFYNRWRGLPIEPIQGDCSLLQAHMRDILCGGDKKLYDYLTGWSAYGVQNPALPTEVAVVLQGAQGVGKGFFAREYGALFTPYFFHASSSEEVVGRFNAHLQEALVLFLDESFWAGDKKSKGTLKHIITEPTLSIEVKYRDRFQTRNMLKIIIASNEPWIIPAGMHERRFFVLDVAPDRMQDQKYFGAIARQLENGGREALMYDLLHRDLTNFDRRTPPRTQALIDQQLLSLDLVSAYWQSILEDGQLPVECEFDRENNKIRRPWGEVPKQRLYRDFCKDARERGHTRLDSIAVFGKKLKKFLPPSYPQSKKPRSGLTRTPVWVFPPLETCRDFWKRLMAGGPSGPGPRGQKPL